MEARVSNTALTHLTAKKPCISEQKAWENSGLRFYFWLGGIFYLEYFCIPILRIRGRNQTFKFGVKEIKVFQISLQNSDPKNAHRKCKNKLEGTSMNMYRNHLFVSVWYANDKSRLIWNRAILMMSGKVIAVYIKRRCNADIYLLAQG